MPSLQRQRSSLRESGISRSGRATRRRLPVCLGKSVRGLLFLPRGEREKAICNDEAVEDTGTLGAAAIKA